MTLLLDLAALLVFPGLAFSLAAGVVSVWLVGWLTPRLAAGPAVSWGELLRDSRRLLELAVHPDAAELDSASALLFFALLAATAAAAALWGALLFPAFWAWGQLYVVATLLALPPLLALYWTARWAGSPPAERKRDLLLAIYLGVLFLALSVPAVQGRSLWLGELAQGTGRSLPLVATAGGALAFLAATGAAAFYLALLDSVWDECLAMVGGAVQALLVQLARAVGWFAVVSALVVPFWSLSGAGAAALVLDLLAYLVLLVVQAGLRAYLQRLGPAPLVSLAWLPLAALALAGLGLALGGW